MISTEGLWAQRSGACVPSTTISRTERRRLRCALTVQTRRGLLRVREIVGPMRPVEQYTRCSEREQSLPRQLQTRGLSGRLGTNNPAPTARPYLSYTDLPEKEALL